TMADSSRLQDQVDDQDVDEQSYGAEIPPPPFEDFVVVSDDHGTFILAVPADQGQIAVPSLAQYDLLTDKGQKDAARDVWHYLSRKIIAAAYIWWRDLEGSGIGAEQSNAWQPLCDVLEVWEHD